MTIATVTSGAISMNNFNSSILQTTSTASIGMDVVRTRYGGSGAISFGSLYKTIGFTMVFGANSETTKGGTSYNTGYVATPKRLSLFTGNPCGSISVNDANGILIAANSVLYAFAAANGVVANTDIYLADSGNTTSATGNFTTGFAPANLTRFVVANTSRTVTANSTVCYAAYDVTSGATTYHCLMQF